MRLRTLIGRIIIHCITVGLFATAATAATTDPGMQSVKDGKLKVTENLIVGTWSAVSPEGRKVKMIFSADGFVKLVVDGKSREGVVTTYHFDPTSNPALLDITAKTNGQESTMLGIVSFLTKDKIKVVMSEQRPTDFSGDTLVFHRKSEHP